MAAAKVIADKGACIAWSPLKSAPSVLATVVDEAIANVPVKHLHAPWTLPPLEQQASGCVIGRDYPAPLVDHDRARKRALEMYGKVKGKQAGTD